MGKKFQKISEIISEEDFFSFFLKVLRYIKNNIFGISKGIIFELDLEKVYPKVATGLELSFRLASEKDIGSMDKKRYDYDEQSKEYAKNRLAKGDSCILALHNGKIIGYLWVMRDHMELATDKLLLLPKNKAYTYKGFVLNEYRGKRIHAAMYARVVDMLKKEGKRFVFSAVDTKNKPALKTKLKNRADYEIIGTLVHIKFFGLKFDYIKKKDLPHILNP